MPAKRYTYSKNQQKLTGWDISMMRHVFSYIFPVIMIFTMAEAQAKTAQVIGTFNDWKAHIYSAKDKKICFVTSQPTEKEPKNVNRGVVVFYLSDWPKDKVRNEISVKIGYTFKNSGATTAEIGTETFKFVVKADKAFVDTREQESKLVEAMKKGNQMVFKGVSSRGTQTTDVYSLAGFSAALNKIKNDCRT